MLFLVTGDIRKTEYYSEPEYYEDTRLVEAANMDEAEKKFEKYFDSLTEQYSVYYSVSCVCAKETII